MQTNILGDIFFILVENIKYGDDIFFIPDENICSERSFPKCLAQREKFRSAEVEDFEWGSNMFRVGKDGKGGDKKRGYARLGTPSTFL